MKKMYRVQDIVSDALLTFAFVFCLLWGAFASLQYRFPVGTMALYVALISAVWIVILRLPTVALVAASLFLIGTIVFLLPMLREPERWRTLFADWNAYGWWVWQVTQSSMPAPPAGYLVRSLLLMCAGSALVVGLMVRVRVHPAVFLLLGGGLFFAQEAFLHDLFTPAFFLFLVCLTLYTVRHVYIARLRRVQSAAPPLHFLAAAGPLCLLAAILAMVIPPGPGNIGQPVIDWAADQDFFWQLGGDTTQVSDFGVFTYAGLKKLDGSDELGGPLRQNRALVLYIKSEHPGYLKGHTYDTYTGRAWDVTADTMDPYQALETVDMDSMFSSRIVERGLPYDLVLPALPGYRPDSTMASSYQLLAGTVGQMLFQTQSGQGVLAPPLDSLFEQSERIVVDETGQPLTLQIFDAKPGAMARRTHEIIFWNMRTDTLFLPQRTLDLRITAPDEDLLVETTRSVLGDMTLPARQGKEFRYKADDYELDLTQDELGDLLRMSQPGMADWLWGGDGLGVGALEDALEYMRREANFAYRTQLQLPDALPERVKALAADITKDAATSYDKALALKTYLQTQFPYDTTVPATPKGRDFVDYFLFDLKSGYCTYYATAMTVMCRAIGLPARYVEGFVPSADRIQGLYYATGEQAHAWSEVYLDGFGWIPFDATASFDDDFSRSFFPGSFEPVEPETPDPKPTPSGSPLSPAPTATPAAAEPPGEVLSIPIWLWAVALGVLFLCALPVWHAHRRRRLQGGRLTRQSAAGMFRRIQRMVHHLGVPSGPNETALEWAGQADKVLGASGHITFTHMAELYSRLCYGPDMPDRADLKRLHGMCETLVNQWKPFMRPTKFAFLRHMLGRF